MSKPEPRFISESIIPVRGSADAGAMARGEPGLPTAFTWRGNPLIIKRHVRSWKETGSCRHGSGESYVRKHWFEVETEEGELAKLYFERQGRGRKILQRWWLYSLSSGR